MNKNFENTIHQKFPFLEGKKLLIAISGGIDSVVLTHLLHQLKFNISIAHCNFHLRGTDSDLDQQFVSKMASALNVSCFITHFNTKEYAKNHKLSIQEAARNLRYHWFEKTRKENNLDYILTGHNLNDSLETFLINLTRGTGLKGLTGIDVVNQKIIRPLSSFTRNEIEIFAKENNITWREDTSNTDIKYTRNKIRHQVIPVLQELNPFLLESFKKTLENLQGSEDIVRDTMEIFNIEKREKRKDKREQQTAFNIQLLNQKIKTNPKAYLHELFSSYGFTNITDIENLLTAQSGKQVFSKTHRLIKNREQLLLVEEKQETRNKKQDSYKVFESDLVLEDNNFKLTLELVFGLQFFSVFNPAYKDIKTDKSLLKFPLTIRKWQKGDYFHPFGMKGKKKLSKYFKDEKLSLLEKENIWLLLSDNKIVWIIGKRQDERFKITQKTKETIQISI